MAPLFYIAFFWNPADKEAESVAGFRGSSVLFRKIGETKLDWPLSASDVTSDTYPMS
jgi:hypothetical protein